MEPRLQALRSTMDWLMKTALKHKHSILDLSLKIVDDLYYADYNSILK